VHQDSCLIAVVIFFNTSICQHNWNRFQL